MRWLSTSDRSSAIFFLSLSHICPLGFLGGGGLSSDVVSKVTKCGHSALAGFHRFLSLSHIWLVLLHISISKIFFSCSVVCFLCLHQELSLLFVTFFRTSSLLLIGLFSSKIMPLSFKNWGGSPGYPFSFPPCMLESLCMASVAYISLGSLLMFLFFFSIYLCICLTIPGLSCTMQTLIEACGI